MVAGTLRGYRHEAKQDRLEAMDHFSRCVSGVWRTVTARSSLDSESSTTTSNDGI